MSAKVMCEFADADEWDDLTPAQLAVVEHFGKLLAPSASEREIGLELIRIYERDRRMKHPLARMEEATL
jgi:hypothetical protein